MLRVLSRITENGEDISKQSTKKSAEDALRAVMPPDAPGVFNQALMELGALVCVPNGYPQCGECPLQSLCRAALDGRQTEFPVKAPKKPRRIEERTVFVIRDSSHAALRRRPARGLLAGLYELPNEKGSLSMEEALEWVADIGFSPIRIRPLPEAKHIFSHVEWHMAGYSVLVEDCGKQGASFNMDSTDTECPMFFIEPDVIRRDYPIPSAYVAYRKFILSDG